MKLKEYVEKLNKLTELHPEALEYDVITSADDEGNHFNSVHYEPSVGFYEYDDFQSLESDDFEDEEPNAVCLN